MVRLGGEALDECRRRVQQELHGHRGRKGEPLYSARLTLHTGADLLTDTQHERITKLFAPLAHTEVECTWGIYQRMITAYRDPDRSAGRTEMASVIDALAEGVPTRLVELRELGRTLARRVCDVLAYFDRPRTSNGPTIATAAHDLHWSMATVSHIERGHPSNRAAIITYRDYLTTQQPAGCAI